jgi:hypothetical protein
MDMDTRCVKQSMEHTFKLVIMSKFGLGWSKKNLLSDARHHIKLLPIYMIAS